MTKHNTDAHKEKASELFSIPVDQITKEQRHVGKIFNFAKTYGSNVSLGEVINNVRR